MSLSEQNSDINNFPDGNVDAKSSTTGIVDTKRVTPGPNECYAQRLLRLARRRHAKQPELFPENWDKEYMDVFIKLGRLPKYGDLGSFAGQEIHTINALLHEACRNPFDEERINFLVIVRSLMIENAKQDKARRERSNARGKGFADQWLANARLHRSVESASRGSNSPWWRSSRTASSDEDASRGSESRHISKPASSDDDASLADQSDNWRNKSRRNKSRRRSRK
jgi:hypothetical protein